MKFLLCLSLVLTLSGCNKNKVENGKEAKNKPETNNKNEKSDKDVSASKVNKTPKNTNKKKSEPQQKTTPPKLKPPIKLMTKYFASMNKIIKENIKKPADTFEMLNTYHQKETTSLDKIRKWYKQMDIKDYEALFTDHKNNKELINAYLDFNKNLVKLAKKTKKMKKVKGYQLFIKNLIRPPSSNKNSRNLKEDDQTPDSPPGK
ncbi:MAG: hypothetical protein PF689_03470 [Deltaproteobacteria bacterium]|jgi:hypothetical protein|nr:hypothetical protein [Deltaproteobacteria bacterium]